jgi:hypothetical protein
MGRWTRAVGCSILAIACKGDPEPPAPTLQLADAAYDPHPQVPAILRDVALIDDDVAFTRPYVPGHRTTMDGRVALRVQGGTELIERLSTNLSFFLFVPERLEEPILTGPSGPTILAETEPFDVVFPPALAPDVFRLGHHAICDPTQEFAAPGERTNPYPCGPETLHDCYDLTVISSTSPALSAQLWGTPVTVEVADPKTARARIVDVTLGEPVMGAEIPASTEWTEPAVTIDGRLLTGRLGRFPRQWTNPNTGETLVRPYDLAYAVLPDSAEPCDITGWTDFHPMSHAPYDPQMIGRYGLAAYPFRDTEGAPIPDGEDMGGTYPWVDREGANLFMTGVHGRLVEQSEARYPRRCVVEGCEQYVENVDFDRGYMVAGLWTHGKLVHLDGMINSIDWAVGVSPAAHWWVDLYRDEAGAPVPIRFGAGRFIEQFREAGGPYPPGYTHNANILDSLQNVLNHRPEARPVTPRDVVWIMSTGVATDEVAFDDLLDPDALIVSNMQASITQLHDDEGGSLAVPEHHNGQVRSLSGLGGVLSVYELDPEAEAEIHLQNGATSLSWRVPAYGQVDAGSARVEPVALGGVDGRGFWMSGDAAIRYALPDQPQVDEVDAYLGVFVDARAPEAEPRELLRFGDGTGIVLAGGTVTYVDGQRILHEVELPSAPGWVHLGWRIGAGHRSVTLLHEGFALDRYDAPAPVFSFGGGELTVGRHTAAWTGFRGWIDDLVLLAHDVDPEVACNHARGTLVELEAPDSGWDAAAERYPDWAHAAVGAAAGAAGGRFACVTDHTADFAAHLGNLPTGTRSVREAITFPEGPLRAGVPRPDSSANAFCLTCHHEEGQGGLSLEALAADPSTPAEHDLRRQPHQPPRRVFGNIPAGWIAPGAGPGSPTEALQAPPEGLLIDPWVLPADATR